MLSIQLFLALAACVSADQIFQAVAQGGSVNGPVTYDNGKITVNKGNRALFNLLEPSGFMTVQGQYVANTPEGIVLVSDHDQASKDWGIENNEVRFNSADDRRKFYACPSGNGYTLQTFFCDGGSQVVLLVSGSGLGTSPSGSGAIGNAAKSSANSGSATAAAAATTASSARGASTSASAGSKTGSKTGAGAGGAATAASSGASSQASKASGVSSKASGASSKVAGASSSAGASSNASSAASSKASSAASGSITSAHSSGGSGSGSKSSTGASSKASSAAGAGAGAGSRNSTSSAQPTSKSSSKDSGFGATSYGTGLAGIAVAVAFLL